MIGLIGGMSYASTITYYKLINEFSQAHHNSLSRAKILISSVDFDEIEELQHNNEWQKAGELLNKEAKRLEKAGANIIALCTNTMHKIANDLQKDLKARFIHIAHSSLKELNHNNIKNILLLGTKYTMQEDFYKKELKGINVITPNNSDINTINDIIFNELCFNVIKQNSKETFINIINKHNIEGILLACTEIALLINENDFKNIKVFDTTYIHAKDIFLQSLE
ncbi:MULTISPECIES: amino acid racemase [unclassified Campylobacter]|uniref:aspartate/glutamate racemase family protein n=2 Tax=Campylobacter TaxID=194 RepID=UPI001BD9D180|nr:MULTISPECIES: amino acid racemase [unclassified Campylobacter]MBZ7982031.1 amino acid racemase [Campylobacter sp. RM12640]MBZ7983508.1 amino acid racemase [Campylobacter sp. RM12647]MBZ7988913.1 amino acid racemase [Campylobacter sp. RM12635]MBZ7993025.1 amino acid racemase [Campylobacter sp. RM9333]MBT0879144.1 amino acid racemase [Campylobacter sp. 2018MI01]